MSDPAPHERRDVAGSFGSVAERYDRARPRYPAAVAHRILASAPGRDVLDVGIGTGISALAFAEAGARVLGIEPDDGMAALARARGFEVEPARFEEWDDRGRRFDVVAAGQTWHWVDPDAGARRAAAVLRPTGLIALMWNVAQPPEDLAAAFAGVYDAVDTGLPYNPWARPIAEAYRGMLDTAESGIRASGGFEGPERWSVAWDQTVARDAWLDQVPTAGGHSLIPPVALEALLEGLGAAIDRAGGSVDLASSTLALTARRSPNPHPS